MYSVAWQIESDILAAYRQKLKKAPLLLTRAYKGEIERITNKVLRALKQQPGPVKYPIRWKTERQRRAFFATNGFGAGIPYKRTNRLANGWQMSFDARDTTGTVEIFNDVPYARFVQGDDAQPFHLDTGWIQAAPLVAQAQDDLTDALIQTWFAIVEFDAA